MPEKASIEAAVSWISRPNDEFDFYIVTRVMDSAGKPAKGLTAEDFRVTRVVPDAVDLKVTYAGEVGSLGPLPGTYVLTFDSEMSAKSAFYAGQYAFAVAAKPKHGLSSRSMIQTLVTLVRLKAFSKPV